MQGSAFEKQALESVAALLSLIVWSSLFWLSVGGYVIFGYLRYIEAANACSHLIPSSLNRRPLKSQAELPKAWPPLQHCTLKP